MRRKAGAVACVLLCGAPFAASGQSPPAAPLLQTTLALLPGEYDDREQREDSERRNRPQNDRYPQTRVTITRVDAPAFGAHAFLWTTVTGDPARDAKRSSMIATLEAGPGPGEVLMKRWLRMQAEIGVAELATLRPEQLRRTAGCEYVFERSADRVRGRHGPRACRLEWDGYSVHTDNEIELSAAGLALTDHKIVDATGRRITGIASGEPLRLERLMPAEPRKDVARGRPD